MNKKQLLSLILCVMMLAILAPASVFAQTLVDSIEVETSDGSTKDVILIDGKSLNLRAKVMPLNADIRNVKWSVACDDPSLCSAGTPATITSTGLSTAKLTAHHVTRAVEVTVTAAAVDKSEKEGTLKVKLLPKAVQLMILDKEVVVTKITEYGDPEHFHPNYLNNVKAPIVKDLGQADDKYLQLEAYIVSSDAVDAVKNVSWSSSNKKIATVDSSGRVTFLRPGTVKITAKTKDGSNLKVTATVTGKILVKEIEISGKTVLGSGKSTTLKKIVYPGNATNKKVVWYSKDRHIATVNASTGKVTAQKVTEPTEVEICAKSTDVDWRNQPIVDTCYTITVYPVVTKVAIQNEEGINVTKKTVKHDLSEGSTQFAAITEPALASGKVTWTSSNKKIATVDEDGLVTFLKNGTVTITAKAADGSGKSAYVKVQIIEQVTDITISADKTNECDTDGETVKCVRAGKSFVLKADVQPKTANIRTVNWVVDNVEPESAAKPFTIKSNAAKVTVTAKDVKETVCADVTAKARDGSGVESNTETICVYPKVRKIIIKDASTEQDISGITLKLEVGETLTIESDIDSQSYPDGSDQGAKWSTSSKKIVSISGGVLTAEKVGTATITVKATDGSGQTAKIKIKVVKAGSGGGSGSGDSDGASAVMDDIEMASPLMVADAVLPETEINAEDEVLAEAAEAEAETEDAAENMDAGDEESVAEETAESDTEEAEKAQVFSISGPAVALPGESLNLTVSVPEKESNDEAADETDAETAEPEAKASASGGADVYWFSSNESAATVDNHGIVQIAETAELKTVVTFTALLDDGNSTFATHNVTIVDTKAEPVAEAAAEEQPEEEIEPVEIAAENSETEPVSEEQSGVETEPAEVAADNSEAETAESSEIGAAEPIQNAEEESSEEAVVSETDALPEAENEDAEESAEPLTEAEAAEESADPVESETAVEETIADGSAQIEDNAEPETPAVEKIEVDIEDSVITVTVGETITIDSEKLSIVPAEADWNTLKFEVANESIAKLDSDEIEKIREEGLAIHTLTAGETKLTIKSGDVEKVIRIVVEALRIVEEPTAEAEQAPVIEEAPAAEEAAAEEVSEAEPETVSEPEPEETTVEETVSEEPAAEPEQAQPEEVKDEPIDAEEAE